MPALYAITGFEGDGPLRNLVNGRGRRRRRENSSLCFKFAQQFDDGLLTLFGGSGEINLCPAAQVAAQDGVPHGVQLRIREVGDTIWNLFLRLRQ